MRIFQAIWCFFKVLFDGGFADEVKQLSGPAEAAKLPAPREAPKPAPPKRSDAVALLATLQREARFVDLVSETLDGYTDAQIGAASREVLAGCGKVLDRVFALKPVADTAEGDPMEVPAGYDTGRLRLTGDVSREPPLSGKLVHAGWEATRCELPSWTGSDGAARVVAPAEVEVG